MSDHSYSDSVVARYNAVGVCIYQLGKMETWPEIFIHMLTMGGKVSDLNLSFLYVGMLILF